MFINKLSWGVRNTLKKHGYIMFTTRQVTGSVDRWHNVRKRVFPKDVALQHFDSFYPNVYEDKWLPIRIAYHWPTKHVALVNPFIKDPDEIVDNYQIKSSNILPSIINSQMFAAKKKSKGRDAKQSSKDSDKEDEDDDDDGDDDDDDDDDILPVDYIDLDIETGNLRLDAVMKTAVPMQRRKIEEIHAEDKIRLNGERVLKRSIDVGEGDIIDCIQGRNRENNKLLDVRRVKLLSVPEYKTAKDRVKFKIRRWPSLTIENYSIHPFESMVARAEEDDSKK